MTKINQQKSEVPEWPWASALQKALTASQVGLRDQKPGRATCTIFIGLK